MTVKNALAEVPRASVSGIHYLYLARIPFLGWLTLIVLPLLAIGVGRPLVLGAYDLASNGEAFFVGLAYGLAAGSIYFTSHIITNLCSKRFRLAIDPVVQRRADKAWASAIILALFLNTLVAASASKPAVSFSSRVGGALVLGMLVAFLGASIAGAISASFPGNPVYRNLVWFGIKVGLRNQNGYLRPVSDNADLNDPANWRYEEGHVRAVSYTFIVIVAYCIITGKQIAPLVALMLLLSLWVLVLAGLTFFWDRYRLPLLAILIAYFYFAGFSLKADHYYRVWTRPVLASGLTPGEIVGRAAQQRRPIVIVAAGGGGIQSSAWTTSVLDQLGERLKADSGDAFDLPNSVRLISGVSGGSVGGMFYAESFSETKPDFNHSFRAACSSALGPTIRGLLRQDLWRALAPFFVTDICNDRGRILEKQWCKSFDNRFSPKAKLADATLSAWAADALSLTRPALIFNSTIVETGQRLAISTVPIRHGLIGETEFTQRYCADIAISTAARLSATFPFVTPTGRPAMQNQNVNKPSCSIESPPPCGGGDQHLVDGGYYENSGVVGAIEWIDDALTDLSNAATNPKHYPLPRNILLLAIDAFERPTDPEDPCPNQTTPPAARRDIAHGVLYNLSSPLHAVINVRGSGQKSFARRLLRMFQRRWALEHVNIQDVKIFFEVEDPANREEHVQAGQRKQALAGKKSAASFYIGVDPGKEPLSWHLRPSEIDELKKQWVGFNKTSTNCSDNYQIILNFFRAESAK